MTSFANPGSPITVNGNPIFSQEYTGFSISSNGSVYTTGNVTFTAEECITLTAPFTVDAGGTFWARLLPNLATETREYCGGLEYVDSDLEAIYFSSGRVFYEGNNKEYQYVLSDYQGNTRALFHDNGSGVVEEIEGYSYYPFGAVHEQESDYNQKYLFGGKELQTELDLGWSDFGTRCMDNWSGKWLGVDILAEAKAGVSPYAYGLGNPVRFSDPTGMIEEDENGLATVSTSLWGRDATGSENSGAVLNSVYYTPKQFMNALESGESVGNFALNENSTPEKSSSSIEALLGLPIDLGAENIVQELADGLRFINALINTFYASGEDDDIIQSYHDYKQSLNNESKGTSFWPILAKNVCDFSCAENNFKYESSPYGNYWVEKRKNLEINIMDSSVQDVQEGKVSYIEYRQKQMHITRNTIGMKYFILLQVEHSQRRKPLSLISISTTNKDVYDEWKNYIEN